MSKQKERNIRILFGFDLDDFKSWGNFVKLMNRPEDPSSLALFRILFGELNFENELSFFINRLYFF
jgi:hypothetical protein